MHQAVVEIKKPCYETLEAFNAEEKGRFCKTCQLTVIDFTTYSTDEIALYLAAHKGEHLCGTFNNYDIKSNTTFDKIITYLQTRKLKFVAVLVIGALILTGCRTRKGKASTTNGRINENQKPKTEHLD